MSPIFIIGLLVILTFIAYATYRTNEALKVWTPEENILLSPPENVARLALIALGVGLGFLSGEDFHTLGWQPLHPAGDILIGVLLGVAIPLLLYAPSRWVETHHPEWYSDVVVESIRPRHRGEWPWVILALLPVAIMEELYFRSLLLGAFAPHVNIVAFVIGVSVIFGLLHIPQGEWGVVGVILVSLILSVVFLWRESLLAVVVAHWLLNVNQLVLEAWTRGRKQESPSDAKGD